MRQSIFYTPCPILNLCEALHAAGIDFITSVQKAREIGKILNENGIATFRIFFF